MPGVKTLSKIQLGRESTAGTAVAATTLWRGTGFPKDTRELKPVEEAVGLIVPTDRAYFPFVGAEMEFDEIEASFEQLPHLFEAGILQIGTGAADGVGSDKIYTYNLPTTSQPTIKTYTIEAGDNQQEEEMEYSFVSELKLTGKAKEAVMMSAVWQGKQLAPSTFTPAISIPAVDDILFQLGKLYIDPDSASWGTTQKSNTLLAFELTYKTGLIPVWTADGALTFSMHKMVRPELKCKITFEHEATSVAEKAAKNNRTNRLIQLKFEGPAVATGGTTYQKKTLLLNMAGKWSTFDKLDEQDGNDIVTGEFLGGYNAAKSSMGAFIVVNELTSIP